MLVLIAIIYILKLGLNPVLVITLFDYAFQALQTKSTRRSSVVT